MRAPVRLMRTLLGLCALVASAALASCAASPPSPLPTPPPLQDGWSTVEKAGLRVALPPEWPIMEDQEDVLVSVSHMGGNPNVFLQAFAPDRVVPQPTPPLSSESLTEWILNRISTSRPDRYARSEVRLPAGPAVLVRFHFDGEVGSFEPVEGVAYAISTADGIAYLQINMSESLLDEFGEAMAEFPLHLTLAGSAD
jgi:hypothetical protein